MYLVRLNRLRATAALQMAEATTSREDRAGYLRLARQWTKLADAREAESGGSVAEEREAADDRYRGYGRRR
ncbi:MAG TPA: hypothetical protein VHW60_23770 [Caulobacteraceae bacterium]|jgi:hypothetical protein|nr:hypothetical protein [Caulobacteraceae bacterium]